MKQVLKLFLHVLYGLPFYFLIRILSFFMIIRFQQIMSERVGHLAANVELYLCEKKFNINTPKKFYIDIFCFGKIISNRFLAKKWKQNILIFPYFFVTPIIAWIKFFNTKKNHLIPHNTMSDRDVLNLFDKSKPSLKLSAAEIDKGYEILSKLNISRNSKFVSIIVRDEIYLKSKFPNKNFSYHNYRDFKIETFYSCFEELTKKGYYVLRMGMKGVPPINLRNKKVIDYANSNLRSDFMDIFIGSENIFHIRTAGYGAIPTIFRRPVLHLNSALGEAQTFYENNLLLIKEHFCKKTKKNLLLDEIFSKNLAFDLTEQKLNSEDVELRENSEDIKNATIEMISIYENQMSYTKEEEKTQDYFWDRYLKNIKLHNKENLHGLFKARFSKDFLKKLI